MSDCLKLPDINIPDFPVGFEPPQIPKIQVGDIEFCCVSLVPQITIDIPLPIPPLVVQSLAAINEAKMKLLEEYFRAKSFIP